MAKGFIRQIGWGLVIGSCVGAIAACRGTPDTAEQPAPSPPPSPTETPTAPPPPDTAPPPEPTPSPDTAQSNAAPAAPNTPASSLPEACRTPQTQLEMNRCAQAEYEQADAQLNRAYQAVKDAVSGQQADQLVAAEQAWIEFRDAYCDFVQAQYAGGSIQPTVYYGCLTQLTRDRTAELQQTKAASMSYEAADQELNTVYQSLQDYLSAAEQEMLTDAQLAWIDYRDRHCDFAGGDRSRCLARVTETRVRQLREQLDTRSL